MLELDGGTLWVTATHLTTRSPEERAAQVAALAGLHTDSMEAGVLVGDFNARPEAPELTALRDRFADAWELARERDDQAGLALLAARRGADPSAAVAAPPDRPGVGVPGVSRSPPPGCWDGEGASDHLPLVVDLEIRSGV